MSTNKIIRGLQRDGYIVATTKNDHLKVTHPSKPGVVFMGSTPSDIRSMRNARAMLRRTFDKPEGVSKQ